MRIRNSFQRSIPGISNFSIISNLHTQSSLQTCEDRKINTDRDYIVRLEIEKAKSRAQLDIGEHSNKNVIFNEYDKSNSNYTNLICTTSEQQQPVGVEGINDTITNNDKMDINQSQKIYKKSDKISSFILKKSTPKTKIIRLTKGLEMLKKQRECLVKNIKINTGIKANESLCNIENGEYSIKVPGRKPENKHWVSKITRIADIQNNSTKVKEQCFYSSRTSNSKHEGRPRSTYSNTDYVASCNRYKPKIHNYSISQTQCGNATCSSRDNKSSYNSMLNAFSINDTANKLGSEGGKVELMSKLEFYKYIKENKLKEVWFIQRAYKRHYRNCSMKYIRIQSVVRGWWQRERIRRMWRRYYNIVVFGNKMEMIWKKWKNMICRDVLRKLVERPYNVKETFKGNKGENTYDVRRRYYKWLEDYNKVKSQLEEKTNGNSLEYANTEDIQDIHSENSLNGNNSRTWRSKKSIERPSSLNTNYRNKVNWQGDCECADTSNVLSPNNNLVINTSRHNQTALRTSNRDKINYSEPNQNPVPETHLNYSSIVKWKPRDNKEKEEFVTPVINLPHTGKTIEPPINNNQLNTEYLQNNEETVNVKSDINTHPSLSSSSYFIDSHRDNHMNLYSNRSQLRQFNNVTDKNSLESTIINKPIQSLNNPNTFSGKSIEQTPAFNKEDSEDYNTRKPRDQVLNTSEKLKTKLIKTILPTIMITSLPKSIKSQYYTFIIDAMLNIKSNKNSLPNKGKSPINKSKSSNSNRFFDLSITRQFNWTYLKLKPYQIHHKHIVSSHTYKNFNTSFRSFNDIIPERTELEIQPKSHHLSCSALNESYKFQGKYSKNDLSKSTDLSFRLLNKLNRHYLLRRALKHWKEKLKNWRVNAGQNTVNEQGRMKRIFSFGSPDFILREQQPAKWTTLLKRFFLKKFFKRWKSRDKAEECSLINNSITSSIIKGSKYLSGVPQQKSFNQSPSAIVSSKSHKSSDRDIIKSSTTGSYHSNQLSQDLTSKNKGIRQWSRSIISYKDIQHKLNASHTDVKTDKKSVLWVMIDKIDQVIVKKFHRAFFKKLIKKGVYARKSRILYRMLAMNAMKTGLYVEQQRGKSVERDRLFLQSYYDKWRFMIKMKFKMG